MDKAILTSKDIDALLAWRDDHQDLVRSMPSPLKGIEIICKDTGFTIKGIRNKEKVDLYLSHHGKSLGAAHFKIAYVCGKRQLAQIGKNTMIVKPEEMQSVITVYCSLMALMDYGNVGVAASACHPERSAAKLKDLNRKAENHKAKISGNSVTYLMRRGKNGPVFTTSGSHASPSGIFSVRGHYRHYKNGTVIWIDEYKKGTGEKKDKTYKL